ncbi:hypothetical protein [Draconibacterium orientale]|uniref:hypothetical protein n=1 Tax=Draconibacterium orientale TaxID=1168034 RepID=UPI0029C038D2|nr:hypothetical protein [Draconibacterium orientale]
MKNLLNYLLILAIGGLFFTACSSDDDDLKPVEVDNVTGLYFVNYGGGSVGTGTITKYDYKNDTVINNYYEAKNGLELTSKIQYGYEYNEKIYLVGNDIDQIIVLDTGFVQHIPGITEGIQAPRYCVGSGEYLYVSCWKDGSEYNLGMPNSYIAKFNINSNTVEETIPVPGGTEGLAIANGNLYAALNYKDSIAVVDLSNDEVSYIETPAVTSYFVEDNSNNLYVALVSTYSDYSETTGLGYINTSNNSLDEIYALGGVSSGYSSILAHNEDVSVIYVLASSWVEQADGTWIQQGAIHSFDTSTKEFTPFVENLSGTNGMVYSSKTDHMYVFGSESYSEPGTVDIYTTDGTYVSEFDCGVSPYWALDLDFE